MSAAVALPFMSENKRAKKPAINRASHARDRFRAIIEDDHGLATYPLEVQAALDDCTPKQRRLALLLASGVQQTYAYMQAYERKEGEVSPSEFASQGSNASAHPKVVNAVQLLNRWLDAGWLLDAGQTVDWAVSNLYDLAQHGKNEATRLKATELLLRKHGELVDRKVVTHIDGTEADTQEALLKSILADVELIPAIETSPAQLLTEPAVRPTSCPRCSGAMIDGPMMGDGDGI